jgi:hypothetical protein
MRRRINRGEVNVDESAPRSRTSARVRPAILCGRWRSSQPGCPPARKSRAAHPQSRFHEQAELSPARIGRPLLRLNQWGRAPRFVLATHLPVRVARHLRCADSAHGRPGRRQREAPTFAASRSSPGSSPPTRGSAGDRCRERARRRRTQTRPSTHPPTRPPRLPLPLPLVSAIRPESFSRNCQSWQRCRAGRRLPIRRSAGVVRSQVQGRVRSRRRSAFAGRGPGIAERRTWGGGQVSDSGGFQVPLPLDQGHG